MKKAVSFQKTKLSAFKKLTALKLVGFIRNQNGRKGTGFAGLEQVLAGNDGCNFYAFSNVQKRCACLQVCFQVIRILLLQQQVA